MPIESYFYKSYVQVKIHTYFASSMRILLLIIIVVGLQVEANAQGYYWQSGTKEKIWKNFTVDAGVGGRMYFGDIQQKGAIFNPIKLAYGAGVRYQWRPRFGFTANFEGRGYRGKAEHGGFPDAIDEMTGNLWGGNVQAEFSWLRWEDFTKRQFTDRDPVRKTNMFIGAGFGVSMFTASYSSRTYTRQVVTDSLGRDTTLFTPVDASGSSGGIGMYVPVTLGGRYRFSPRLCLGFEFQRQIYITKNIDAYPSKGYDGMGLFLVRLGYTFAQNKRKGDAKKIGKKGSFK